MNMLLCLILLMFMQFCFLIPFLLTMRCLYGYLGRPAYLLRFLSQKFKGSQIKITKSLVNKLVK